MLRVLLVSFFLACAFTLPASAAIEVRFRFENDNGRLFDPRVDIGEPFINEPRTDGFVSGRLIFSSFDLGDAFTEQPADGVVIDNIPSYMDEWFNDAFGFQVGENMLAATGFLGAPVSVQDNAWDFDGASLSIPTGRPFDFRIGTHGPGSDPFSTNMAETILVSSQSRGRPAFASLLARADAPFNLLLGFAEAARVEPTTIPRVPDITFTTLNNPGVIPEPLSFFVWAGLAGIVGAQATSRRRRA